MLHLTTARELELFERGPIANKRITAEVCAHHLFFNDTWYATKGALIKCNPAIKTASDQQALLDAVNDGRIDVIATDHAPHTLEEKSPQIRTGAVRTAARATRAADAARTRLRRAAARSSSVVEKTAHAPARLFHVAERGFIREGYWADLTLIDPSATTEVDTSPVYSKCGWTPFGGLVFRSRVRATFVNGRLMYHEGAFESNDPGMALRFERS